VQSQWPENSSAGYWESSSWENSLAGYWESLLWENSSAGCWESSSWENPSAGYWESLSWENSSASTRRRRPGDRRGSTGSDAAVRTRNDVVLLIAKGTKKLSRRGVDTPINQMT
jgi:hypothetical protein